MAGFEVHAVASLLEATAAAIRSEVEALPEEVRQWRPAPGEWCVNEVLGHLLEAERRGVAGPLPPLLGEEGPPPGASEPPSGARERGGCRRPRPRGTAGA